MIFPPRPVKLASNVHESTMGNQTLESVPEYAYLSQLLIEQPAHDKKGMTVSYEPFWKAI